MHRLSNQNINTLQQQSIASLYFDFRHRSLRWWYMCCSAVQDWDKKSNGKAKEAPNVIFIVYLMLRQFWLLEWFQREKKKKVKIMHEPEYMGRSLLILFPLLCLTFVNFTFYSFMKKTYHELFSVPFFFSCHSHVSSNMQNILPKWKILLKQQRCSNWQIPGRAQSKSINWLIWLNISP